MRHLNRLPSPLHRCAAFVATLPLIVLLATPLAACASSHTHARHSSDSHGSFEDADGFA